MAAEKLVFGQLHKGLVARGYDLTKTPTHLLYSREGRRPILLPKLGAEDLVPPMSVGIIRETLLSDGVGLEVLDATPSRSAKRRPKGLASASAVRKLERLSCPSIKTIEAAMRARKRSSRRRRLSELSTDRSAVIQDLMTRSAGQIASQGGLGAKKTAKSSRGSS